MSEVPLPELVDDEEKAADEALRECAVHSEPATAEEGGEEDDSPAASAAVAVGSSTRLARSKARKTETGRQITVRDGEVLYGRKAILT